MAENILDVILMQNGPYYYPLRREAHLKDRHVLCVLVPFSSNQKQLFLPSFYFFMER